MAAVIDCLPPEILSSVFVTLVQASRYAASIGDTSYHGINYALQVSSVCVRWRQVAIGTPILWSFLDIFPSGGSLRNLKYLNMCQDRSAGAPLKVRIGKHGRECYQDTVDEQLSSLLSTYAVRSDSLAICYRSQRFIKAVLSNMLIGKAISRVRTLALNANWEDDLILADSSLSQDTLDELLEPLHSLYLECVAFDWDTIRCRNLVDVQLIRLYGVASPSAPQLLSFLNANPTIRRLTMSSFDLSTYDSGLPQIQLPELQNLELQLGQEFTQWLFPLLTPGTREITLQIYSSLPKSHRTQVVVNALCPFFQRSRIVTLHMLRGCCIPFSSVAAYLPHLETLRAYTPVRGYDLSNINPQTELLPRLRTVELVQCTTRHVESGLRTVLSLPSISQITFPYFYSVDKAGATTSISIDQVKEQLRAQGVTANLRIVPELLFRCSQSPFL